MKEKRYQLQLRIKKTRMLRKMSQKELAKRINSTQSYISKIERDLENPSIETLYKIACALKVCPRLLLKRSDFSHCDICKCCVDKFIEYEKGGCNLDDKY